MTEPTETPTPSPPSLLERAQPESAQRATAQPEFAESEIAQNELAQSEVAQQDSAADHSWATASYELAVNGAPQAVDGAWIGESLVFVLRERLGFTAAKDGCAEGECGACTVLMDGQPVAACLVPAVAAVGRAVETPEIHAVPRPDAVASALAAQAGAGCGFCLPGIGTDLRSLLARNSKPSVAAVREALSGHRCRCLPVDRFVAAANEAAATLAAAEAAEAVMGMRALSVEGGGSTSMPTGVVGGAVDASFDETRSNWVVQPLPESEPERQPQLQAHIPAQAQAQRPSRTQPEPEPSA